MSDVFISYSRKDIAFARMLHEALSQNELETWIDWQDIPPSADWLAEIYEAIEQSDAFVFIISDTSVASEICEKEIAHAIQHNKRLIPIVINEIETGKVPKELTPLNWIFFQDDDQAFKGATESLIYAITVDQDWVKDHTRLQNRALEWDRKEKDRSLLLRGAELSEAEAWLSQSADKDPQPTSLQTQYLLAAREDATRRQRFTLFGVTAGLILAIALGIVAWTQRNVAVREGYARATAQAEAEAARVVAEEQRDLAIARGAAAEARQRLADGYWDEALLLAIESAQAADIDESRRVLREVLNHPGQMTAVLANDHVQIEDAPDDANRMLMLSDEIIENIYLDPGGLRFLVLTGANNPNSQATIWDIESGEPTLRFQQAEALAVIAGQADPREAAWSPDGSMIATWYNLSNHLEVWDAESGERMFDFINPDGYIHHAAWNPVAPLLVTLSFNAEEDPGVVRVWDVQTGELLYNLEGHNDQVVDASWNSSGTQLLTLSQDGTARVWRTSTGSQAFVLEGHSDSVRGGEWNTDDSRILTFSRDGSIRIWDGLTGEELLVIQEFSEVRGATWANDETRILAYGGPNDFDIYLFGAETGEIKVKVSRELAEFIASVEPNPRESDNRWLLATETGRLQIFNSFSSFPRMDLSGYMDSISMAAWSPNGRYIAAAGQVRNESDGSVEGAIMVWNASTGDLLVVLGGEGERLVWAEDNEHIAALGEFDAYLWTINASPELAVIKTDEELLTMQWGEDENSVLVSVGEQVEYWDMNAGELIMDFSTDNEEVWIDNVFQLALNVDSTLLLTRSDAGWLEVWDIQGNLVLDPYAGEYFYGAMSIPFPDYRILDADWSSDGQRILTAGCFRDYEYTTSNEEAYTAYYDCQEGILAVWDVNGSTRQPLHEFRNYVVMNGAAWNPSESLVLAYGTRSDSSGENERHAVWIIDLENDKVLLELHEDNSHEAVVVAWSHDGRYAAAGFENGQLRVWEVDDGTVVFESMPHTYDINSIQWNQDDSLILTSGVDGLARVLDARTGESILTLAEHSESVSSAAWNQDETLILTYSQDTTAMVWNADNGELIQTLRGHEDVLTQAMWNDDGTRVVTASIDGSIRQWIVDLDTLIETACQRAPHNFTPQTWRKYFGSLDFEVTCPLTYKQLDEIRTVNEITS